MKSIDFVFVLFVFSLMSQVFGLQTSYAEDSSSAEDKAKELHRLASSDVIYQDQEIKALYYQNLQMIDLLKQIRDLLDSRLKEKSE